MIRTNKKESDHKVVINAMDFVYFNYIFRLNMFHSAAILFFFFLYYLCGHSPTFCDIQEGVMGTSDEETRRYFKHSSVQVLLCPRSAGKGSWAKKQVGLSITFS